MDLMYQTEDIVLQTARLLELFPDDPAQGSPYSTGNETFGMNQSYRRMSAFVGDVAFDAGTRDFRVAASAKAPTWAFYNKAHLASPTNDNSVQAIGVFHGGY